MYAFKCGNHSKNKLKGICKTQPKEKSNLRNIIIVHMEKKVINKLLDLLIVKCIFNNYKNLHYHHLTINVVTKKY